MYIPLGKRDGELGGVRLELLLLNDPEVPGLSFQAMPGYLGYTMKKS